ncbi:MAG: AAA family ATPase [Ardenticatenaceae bacterium]
MMDINNLPADLQQNLRPHEQKMVVRWMEEEQRKPEKSNTEEAALSTGLGSVLRRVRQLCQSKDNWGQPQEEKVTCAYCKDQGYVLPPPTKENLTCRRAYPCPHCMTRQREQYRQQIQSEIKANWPVEPWLIELGSKPINLTYINQLKGLTKEQKASAKDTLTIALKLARTFATDLPPSAVLSFNGRAGSAKTHLLAKIYRYCVLKHKLACIYLRGRDFQQIVTDFKRDASGEIAFYHKKGDLIACDLLLLDEADRISIKAQNNGFGWTENELLDLIDKRMSKKRPTVLAGNWLGRLPEPILSRANARGSFMVDMTNVPDGRPFFDGDDSWLRKAFA